MRNLLFTLQTGQFRTQIHITYGLWRSKQISQEYHNLLVRMDLLYELLLYLKQAFVSLFVVYYYYYTVM